MKIVKWVLLVVVAVVVIGALVVYFKLNSIVKSQVETQASHQLNVPTSLGSEQMIPTPGSPGFNSPIRGSLLLFRVKIASFENRPLEFIIRQPGSDEHAQVPLDV